MKFDMVFDVQKGFRKVVEAFSYPGDIVSLKDEIQYLDMDWSCYPSTILLMYMLLDTDTSFAIDSKDEKLAIQFSKMTYGKKLAMDQAAFVFVTRNHTEQLSDIIDQAYCGTLEDPHQGATLIVECDRLLKDGSLCLSGCGILGEKQVQVKLEDEWVEAREEKNHEFPLGIDMILTDAFGNVMALPRTTRIRKG